MTLDRPNPVTQLVCELFLQPWQMALRQRSTRQCNDNSCRLSHGSQHAGPCHGCLCGADHAVAECPESFRWNFGTRARFAPKVARPYLVASRAAHGDTRFTSSPA